MTVRTHVLLARSCALLLAGCVLVTLSPTPAAAVPDYLTAESGNPFMDGWCADPDTRYYGGRSGSSPRPRRHTPSRPTWTPSPPPTWSTGPSIGRYSSPRHLGGILQVTPLEAAGRGHRVPMSLVGYIRVCAQRQAMARPPGQPLDEHDGDLVRVALMGARTAGLGPVLATPSGTQRGERAYPA
jgi:hypothetical protein